MHVSMITVVLVFLALIGCFVLCLLSIKIDKNDDEDAYHSVKQEELVEPTPVVEELNTSFQMDDLEEVPNLEKKEDVTLRP